MGRLAPPWRARRLVSLVLASTVLTLLPAQHALGANGTFTRSPDHGPPGTVIHLVAVSPCPPSSASVQVGLFDSHGAAIANAQAPTNQQNPWQANLTVPSGAAPGNDVIQAVCNPGGPAYSPQAFKVDQAEATTTSTTSGGGNTTTTKAGTTQTTGSGTVSGVTTTVRGPGTGAGATTSSTLGATTVTTVHEARNPITGPWPQLSDDDKAAVKKLIDANDNAGALAELVTRMKKYCCNFATMAGGGPTYDATVVGEGTTERAKGGAVKIGPSAFSSVAWLYSSLKHEMVHSQQWQDPEGATRMESRGRERQAYQREIDNADNTGVSPDEKRELERRKAAY